MIFKPSSIPLPSAPPPLPARLNISPVSGATLLAGGMRRMRSCLESGLRLLPRQSAEGGTAGAEQPAPRPPACPPYASCPLPAWMLPAPCLSPGESPDFCLPAPGLLPRAYRSLPLLHHRLALCPPPIAEFTLEVFTEHSSKVPAAVVLCPCWSQQPVAVELRLHVCHWWITLCT